MARPCYASETEYAIDAYEVHGGYAVIYATERGIRYEFVSELKYREALAERAAARHEANEQPNFRRMTMPRRSNRRESARPREMSHRARDSIDAPCIGRE